MNTLILLLLLQDPHPGVDQKKVDEAIDKGAQWLLKQKYKPFEFYGECGPMRCDELVLYTLIHAGVDRENEVFQKLLKNVLETPLARTYMVSLQAMVLQKLDAHKYQWRLRQCGQYLVDNQARNGGWYYGREVKQDSTTDTDTSTGTKDLPKIMIKRRSVSDRETGDNSNTQYAVLGLRACIEANVHPPKETLVQARAYWERGQNRDGGWGYEKRGDASYGSMTAGAVSSLVILRHYLKEKWKDDPAVGSGVQWLIKNWTVKTNPGHGDEWRHYYLYAVERTGIVTGLDKFGSIDWYKEGANFLLESQNGEGWWSEGNSWAGPVKDTCFAILFLRRATVPLPRVATPGSGK